MSGISEAEIPFSAKVSNYLNDSSIHAGFDRYHIQLGRRAVGLPGVSQLSDIPSRGLWAVRQRQQRSGVVQLNSPG
jgi:hypothetical protein